MSQTLLHGYARFRAEYFASEHALLESLAAGQAPHALFVGCSDSRVVPEVITSAAPGDLFVTRNVANQVCPEGDPEVCGGAVVEYAVQVLKVRDVIVCGHTRCGGVHAALYGGTAGMPALTGWLQNLAPAVERVLSVAPEEQERAAVQENVLLQLDRVLSYPAARAAAEAGLLALHGWVYDLDTARISVYEPAQDAFVVVQDQVSSPEEGRRCSEHDPTR